MSIRSGTAPSSDAPSARIPVPESRITRLPSSGRTSTHEVLPPYRTVSGPGDAREPREPQNLARTSGLLGRLPEDGEPAHSLVLLGKKRHAEALEVAGPTVHRLNPHVPVARDPCPERRRERQVGQGDRRARGVHRLERPRELGTAHLRLGVRAPEDLLRRLVEEDEVSVRVDEEHRGREVGGEILGQDQGDVSLLRRRLPHDGDRTTPARTRVDWTRTSTARRSRSRNGPRSTG